MAKIMGILKGILFPDPDTRAFRRFNRETWGREAYPDGKAEILVELYPVTQTVIAFSYFANILARRHRARIVSFSSSVRNNFLYTLRHGAMYATYKSFNVRGHVNSRPTDPEVEAAAQREYRRLLPLIKAKQDVFGIEVEGCRIGCDIYEAYLYEHMRPTVDPSGDDFRGFLLDSLRFFYFWWGYIGSRDVKALILSHGLYKYGMMKRICIRKGIPVYLPSARSMLYLSRPEELGNPPFEWYREHFRRLPENTRREGIAWAKAQLDRRMSGEVGVDMHYSTKSAYGKPAARERILAESPRLKVLIATHCFFDNPHAYGVNMFPDFYEWLEYLGSMSNRTGYDWYLKTHPDVLPGNNEILAEILARYPRIRKLPETASHHQLCEEGMAVVLTTYGSIGHEYPLLGRQVVNAGMNPHIAYGFNHHPASLEEYEHLLLNLDKLDKKADLQELYEFYFIHYKCNTCDHLFFDSFAEFLAKVEPAQQIGPGAYGFFLRQAGRERHRELVRTIEDFLDSREYKYYEPQYSVSARDGKGQHADSH